MRVFWKRLIDIGVSAVVLSLLSPIFFAIGIAIVIDSGWPIFFSQVRVGRGFRMFQIWKFRSMRTRASGPPITVAGDARVTNVGRLLRATKLDELPQFWNVLRGDMSIVGPRPELPEYVERFHGRYVRILSLRPGITDLASLAYCDEERLLAEHTDPHRVYVERVLPAKLNLADEYVTKRSVVLDFYIMLKTIFRTFTTRLFS